MSVMLAEHIALFLTHARDSRRLAKTSHKQYQSHLRRFNHFLGDDAPLFEFSSVSLKRWYYHLLGTGLRPSGLRAIRHAVIAFGEWLVSEGLMAQNPGRQMPNPKQDVVIRETCTDEEVDALFLGCERMADVRRASQARALLCLFVYAGLRRTEALRLTLADVTPDLGSVYIRSGKGDKPGKAMLNQETREALGDWLRVRGHCRHSRVWDIDRTRHMADAGLRTLWRDLMAAAGRRGATNLLPHSLRHYYATSLLRHETDLRTVQAALRHTSLMTTLRYLHTEDGRVESANERISRRNRGTGKARREPQKNQEFRRAGWRRER